MSIKYDEKKKKQAMNEISVIIPAFNAASYVGEAIQSVLDQTTPADEIIVVSDGSTDDTAQTAENFPAVRVIHQENMGCAVARNTGINASSGEWLAFLDADDAWLPEKLFLQKDYLKNHPSCPAVFGMVDCFVSPEIDEKQKAKLFCPEGPLIGICAGAMLIRREAFFSVGAFDPKMRLSQFIEWFNRFAESGLAHHVLPDVVLRRRVHLTNTTALKREDVHRNYLHIARSRMLRSKNGRD